MKETNIKSIRKLPLRMSIVLIILVGASMLQSAENIGTKMISFKARISNKFSTKTYKEVALNKNYFVTGLEGDVMWKPKSFYEAFILENVVTENAPFALLNFLYLMVLDAILFWMVYDIEANNIFSKKILKGFSLISVFIALWMVKGILQFYLSNYCIKEITGGQFEAVKSNFSLTPYLFLGTFFQIVSYFILKGQKIEQEQQLTV